MILKNKWGMKNKKREMEEMKQTSFSHFTMCQPLHNDSGIFTSQEVSIEVSVIP